MGAQGHTIIDFGAFPGASDASVAVTGQAGILTTHDVEAWVRLEATSDHSADEHWVEAIEVKAGNIVAGTGFTIYAKCTNQLSEAQVDQLSMHQTGVQGRQGGGAVPTNIAPRLYGQWSVSWVWN